jgi:hypothetical protein
VLEDEVEQVMAQLDEARALALPRAARARDVDLDDLAHATGPRAHHADRVGEQDGLVDVVRDERDRAAVTLPELRQEALRAGARERVERAERLVHEQHPRVVGERTGDRDALLHASGQLLGEGVGEAGQAHLLDQRARLVAALAAPDALELRAELDVAAHGHPRIERVGLEHHAAVGARPVDRMPVDQHVAGARLDEPRHDVQERRLAAPRRTDEAGEMGVGNLERDTVERVQLPAPRRERHRDVASRDRAHRSARST